MSNLKLYTQSVPPCPKCILVKFSLENAGVLDKVEIIDLTENPDSRIYLQSNESSKHLTGLPILQDGNYFTNDQQVIISTVVNK